VGLVWLALAWDGDERTTRIHLTGDRDTIRLVSSRVALEMLRRKLLER
jgi:nicotinamide mononucleotide (NMN) deamidase PncC